MENKKEMNKCINALDTKAARYIDCDSVTDVEYLKDCIESLKYHKKDLDSAIDNMQNRIDMLEDEHEHKAVIEFFDEILLKGKVEDWQKQNG